MPGSMSRSPLLGSDLTVRRQTPQAESDLRALLPTEESRHPIPAAAYNAAAQLLAVEAGIDAHRPMARTTVAPGHWITVEAARLGEDIAVTIGPLEQRDRWTLLCRTYGLSDRETQILICLAEGDDTHALAARLHLSEHTVQDHLKSTLNKTAVNSRRELLTRARGA
jgi:DNA-binding NarL/FixJ family response regulator